MKRCPQCEFVYEDEQTVCDMDGSELLNEALSVPLPPLDEIKSEPPGVSANPSSRSFVMPAFAGIILATLLFVAYYATTHGRRSPNAGQTTASATAAAPQPLIKVDPQPTPASSASPLELEPTLADPAPSEPQPRLAARLSSGPVSAAGSSARNRGPVIIRLTNGASISADEAWEKREGIWYRQAGLVTFLKRSKVRAIERPTPVRPASPTPLPAKPKSASTPAKKDSRVSSILKTTGRILKRPFKF
jgi:hypothetical protein